MSESLSREDAFYARFRRLYPAPRHVAIIMDGNGRWAEKRKLPRIAGHRAGAKAIRRVVQAAGKLGVEVLTLYAFSTENWKRPAREVTLLMRLLERYLRQETPKLLRSNVRLRAIGRRQELPVSARRLLEQAERATQACSNLQLVLALSYSGRADLTDAARALAVEARAGRLAPEEIQAEQVAGKLSTAGLPEVDLLIRTSGEMRISNFLLWETAYAEFVVTKTLWPDFGEKHFMAAIREYHRRERRFGGLLQNKEGKK